MNGPEKTAADLLAELETLRTRIEDLEKDGKAPDNGGEERKEDSQIRRMLSVRTGELMMLNQDLQREVALRKRSEEALRESEERCRRLSEKMEALAGEQAAERLKTEGKAAIDRLTSVIASEVRIPLSNIILGVDSLRWRLGASKENLEILGEIQYGIDILNRLVVELLDYAKPIRLEYSKRPVGALVKDALRRISSKPHQVITSVEMEQGDREISVDVEKITIAFTNLFSNAMEAMPDGGSLRVTSKYADNPGNGMLKICVSDTGPGIDEDNLQKVREPFFTTKSAGIGLGLAICNKIIEAHSGSLSITSRPNEGTTVEITLPIAPGTP